MSKPLPIPLELPTDRRALTRMYIELTLAFHATIYPMGQAPAEIDANLSVVAVAVLEGHAAGHPMNLSEIARRVHMPRESVRQRLNTLIEHGLVVRIDDRYYLERARAKDVPHRDTFQLILAQAFANLFGNQVPKSGE